jgi:hypothetical protein
MQEPPAQRPFDSFTAIAFPLIRRENIQSDHGVAVVSEYISEHEWCTAMILFLVEQKCGIAYPIPSGGAIKQMKPIGVPAAES